MKVCPVCGARAFDDAKTCFGCLHSFSDEPIAQMGKHTVRRLELPTLVISVDAVREEGGGLEWRCTVDQAKPRLPTL